MCRRRNSALGSVTAFEHLSGPAGAFLALPDCDQKSCDVANHVLQERIGYHIDSYPVSSPRDPDSGNVTYRGRCLATGGPEGREIVLATQAICRPLHV